jgi:nucleotide-binding universal stress UspA family protein
MTGTIVCDVSGSPEGRNPAEFAYALGSRLGLRVVLVFVVDSVPPAARESLSSRQRQIGAERTLSELTSERELVAETRVAVGDHVEALARVAAEEGADLLILGSRAVGFGGRNLRCRLVRDLEAATSVPVLVAPPSTRKRSELRLGLTADAGTR